MKNRNKLQLIIATITLFTAGLIYGDLVTTNYLAQDTAIIEDSLNNMSHQGTIIIGNNSGIHRGLLKAANPDVPGGYEITNATLYILQDAYGAGSKMDLYSMLTPWDEDYVNWTNRTDTETWSIPGMAAGADYNSNIVATATSSAVPEWLTFDVTDEVQGFANKTATNNGWFFKKENEAGFARFRTVHGDNGKAMWPYLKLQYRALTKSSSAITNAISTDSQIVSASPNATAGGSTTMEMGYSSSKGIQRGLIKCNCPEVASIPSNAIILSADLRIYQNNLVGENNFIDIHRILKNWDADSTSWNSNTVASAWSSPGMEAGADYKAVATDTSYMPLNEYVTFDVTDDVRAFLNGTAINYGWVLMNQIENNVDKLAVFRTDDATKAVVIIRYHVLLATVLIVQ
jgi:hypothetical protein